MIGFLTSATATWALWKLYDAWVERAAGPPAGTGPGGLGLDPVKLALALQDLDELETAPAQALRSIADAVRADPQRATEVINDQLRSLPAEQRAAVALALLLAAQRVQH